MTSMIPGRPKLLYIQAATSATVKGHLLQSNRDPTVGGGQRDVRIRPIEVFEPILRRMFPEQGRKPGVTRGTVHWFDEAGNLESVAAEIWRPTDAREGEIRINKIHQIGGWHIDLDEFEASEESRENWFYLLVLDDQGRVWARVLRERALPNENRRIRQFIQKRMEATRGSAAVRGALDIETGKEYPE